MFVPADPGMFVLGIDVNGGVCGVGHNPRHRSLSWLKVWGLVDLAAEIREPRGSPSWSAREDGPAALPCTS